MKTIKYIGPFLRVVAENITFVRHIPVELPEAVAAKLLGAKLNAQSVFTEVVKDVPAAPVFSKKVA